MCRVSGFGVGLLGSGVWFKEGKGCEIRVCGENIFHVTLLPPAILPPNSPLILLASG